MSGGRLKQDGERCPVGRRVVGLGVVMAVLTVAACANDPGATLIPMPEPEPSTVSAADVPATTPDGYPNISSMPVVVGGVPLTREEQAATEGSLAGNLAAQGGARPAPVSTTAAELQAAGATHEARARAAIGGS